MKMLFIHAAELNHSSVLFGTNAQELRERARKGGYKNKQVSPVYDVDFIINNGIVTYVNENRRGEENRAGESFARLTLPGEIGGVMDWADEKESADETTRARD